MIKKILFAAFVTLSSSLIYAQDVVVYENGFETNEQLADLRIANLDDDEDCWEVWNGASSIAHSGDVVAMSYSYINGDGPRNPDNWIILPNITLDAGAQLHFFVKGLDPNWCQEHYGVFISENGDNNFNPDSYTLIYENYSPAEYGDGVTVDLAAYEGKNVSIAFRHYNIFIPMFALLLDDISITQQAPSAINDIHLTESKVGNNWYDLHGRSYNERPTTAGVYINNGKKYIIK